MNAFLVRCTVVLKNESIMNWQSTVTSVNERLMGNDLLKIQDEITKEYKGASVFFDLIYRLHGNYE